MSIGDAPSPLDQDQPTDSDSHATPSTQPSPTERFRALIEVTLCSGFPTQLALILVLAMIGAAPPGGTLPLLYVVVLSLADAVLVLGLIWVLLRVHGERAVPMFLGVRPIGREATLGLLLVPAALLLVAAAFRRKGIHAETSRIPVGDTGRFTFGLTHKVGDLNSLSGCGVTEQSTIDILMPFWRKPDSIAPRSGAP